MATYVKVDVDLMNKLVTSFDKTHSNLTNDGYSISGYLDQAWEDTAQAKPVNTSGTWANGEVPSLRRRAALAVTAAAAEPGPLKPGMVVKVDEDQISTLTPAQAKAAADKAVADLKNGTKSDGTLPLSTVQEIEKYQNDPYFAAEFAKTASPSDLAHLTEYLQLQRTHMDQNPSQYMPDYAGKRQQLIDAQTRLMKALGVTLSVATSNTGDLALPKDYAQKWVTAATTEYGGGMTMSAFLKQGQWGTQFLTDYNKGLITFEQSDNCPPHFWAKQSGRDVGQGDDPLNYPDGSSSGWDGTAGALAALGKNPAAAQNVLNDQDTLNYLIKDRLWGDDKADGFGKAVDAATEVLRNNGATGKTSAQIASMVVHTFGASDGDEKPWERLSTDDRDQSMQNMRDSMGRLFASYIADVDRVAAQNGDDTQVPGPTNLPDTGMPGGQPWGANFSLSELQNVLGRTETDDDAFKTVSAAGLAYETSRLNYALQNGGSTTSDTYTSAVEHDAAVMGLLMSTGGVANVAVGKEKDARTAEWLGLAQGAADMIPLPESKLLEFAVSQGEDKLVDSLQTDYAGAAADKADSTSTAMENTLRQQTVAALYRNGSITVGGPYDPVTSYPHGKDFASYTLGPDGKPRIVLSDPKDLGPQARQEYQNWLNSAGSPWTKIEPTVLAVYNNEFKKYWG